MIDVTADSPSDEPYTAGRRACFRRTQLNTSTDSHLMSTLRTKHFFLLNQAFRARSPQGFSAYVYQRNKDTVVQTPGVYEFLLFPKTMSCWSYSISEPAIVEQSEYRADGTDVSV